MRHTLTILLLAGALGGCAGLDPRGTPAEQADHWLAGGQLGRALDALAGVGPEHPDFHTLNLRREELARQAAAVERDALERGRDQEQQDNWLAALAIYADALRALPASMPLRVARERALEGQRGHRAQLSRQLANQRAQWLMDEAALREELLRVDPKDSDSRWALADNARERRQLAAQFQDYALDAVRLNDLEQALRDLDLAYRLEPSPERSRTLESVRLIKDERQRASRQKPVDGGRVAQAQRSKTPTEHDTEERRQTEAAVLRHVFGQVVQAGRLTQARGLLARLTEIDGDNPEVQTLQESLGLAIASRVREGIDSGRSLYGQGEVEAALTAWREVQLLDPDNGELRAHIDRAERVLDKLHRLKERSGMAAGT